MFTRPDSYTNNNVWQKKQFCSRKCRGVSERTSVEKQCQQCDKTMSVMPYQLSGTKKKKYCSYPCRSEARKLMVVTEETRKKLSAAQLNRTDSRIMPRGDKHHLWKGGKGTERHQAMGRQEYKSWRKAIFERDKYSCVECAATKTYFHADHIVGWSEDDSLRYEISNGQTLCYKCHYKKTFGALIEEKALMWGVPKKLRGGIS